MIITFIHHESGETLTITTSIDDADTATKPIFAGTPELLDGLQAELSTTAGMYGHLIDPNSVSNADLYHAAYELPSFEVLSVDGEPDILELDEDDQT